MYDKQEEEERRTREEGRSTEDMAGKEKGGGEKWREEGFQWGVQCLSLFFCVEMTKPTCHFLCVWDAVFSFSFCFGASGMSLLVCGWFVPREDDEARMSVFFCVCVC